MKLDSLQRLLSTNTYPGRGIVLGVTPDGRRAVIAYFIMGRSVNSRNRIFVSQPDGGIITKAFDESKMVDPSLIIYAPVRVPSKGVWIVTNGDQTDTVFDFLAEGKSFEDALRTRTFEPDPPRSASSSTIPSPPPGRATSSTPTAATGTPSPPSRASRSECPSRMISTPSLSWSGRT